MVAESTGRRELVFMEGHVWNPRKSTKGLLQNLQICRSSSLPSRPSLPPNSLPLPSKFSLALPPKFSTASLLCPNSLSLPVAAIHCHRVGTRFLLLKGLILSKGEVYCGLRWRSHLSADEKDWQRAAVESCAESEGFHMVSMVVLDEFHQEASENGHFSTQKFDEWIEPKAYAFALLENHGGREAIIIRAFLADEVKDLESAVPKRSQRLPLN